MRPGDAAEALREHFGDTVTDVSHFRGEATALVDRVAVVDVAGFCKEGLGFDFLVDLTCVDWLDREPRFDVVYHLLSSSDWQRLRLKLHTDPDVSVPSVSGVWGAANWAEREVFDLFGVEFENHPDLRRLLLPDGWTGHPLRKDYPQSQITLPRPRGDKTFE
ncbi:MAG TPA: NADH-quinone oxidoreductase subunit C [Chloroflexota bacterium]|nr:NADH-quinone oxidoreductase subunit C [Chloroflexota bacterium]